MHGYALGMHGNGIERDRGRISGVWCLVTSLQHIYIHSYISIYVCIGIYSYRNIYSNPKRLITVWVFSKVFDKHLHPHGFSID